MKGKHLTKKKNSAATIVKKVGIILVSLLIIGLDTMEIDRAINNIKEQLDE